MATVHLDQAPVQAVGALDGEPIPPRSSVFSTPVPEFKIPAQRRTQARFARAEALRAARQSKATPPIDAEQLTAEADYPGEPALPTADWIEVQAQLLRVNCDSPLGSWLARKIDALAAEFRRLEVETIEDYEARAELQEQWARDAELERWIADQEAMRAELTHESRLDHGYDLDLLRAS